MEDDPKLYEKILDIFLMLRDTRERFQTYSSTDIKQLIKSKLKSIREPVALQHLYKLEAMITELRHTFIEEKDKQALQQ
jgi:hypothetical protein